MNGLKIVVFAFSLLFFFSCESEKKNAPTVLLNEKQMVDVMTDVQTMEAMISFKKNASKKTEYLRGAGYDTLFAHYGITDSIFKLNVAYYNEYEPQALIRIMDSVEARFAKLKKN